MVAYFLNELWLMDIFDLSRYYLNNNNYKYILWCIDVVSRKAFVQPMLSKNEVDVKRH